MPTTDCLNCGEVMRMGDVCANCGHDDADEGCTCETCEAARERNETATP